MFKTLKAAYSGQQLLEDAESQFWLKNGYFDFGGFQELLDSKYGRL